MNNQKNEQEILENIKRLEIQAKQILTMKKELRQRRPIVIEFCGSPKSGKTSCINSLNIFLKRNGFKTEIIGEQASICPIPYKDEPTFNMWTINSTINILNTLLTTKEEKIDIIISDRAIFDALCWFEWMYFKKKLNREELNTLVEYITMDNWAQKSDLIYIFKADPSVSIQREYANLLTREVGSIMNEKL